MRAPAETERSSCWATVCRRHVGREPRARLGQQSTPQSWELPMWGMEDEGLCALPSPEPSPHCRSHSGRRGGGDRPRRADSPSWASPLPSSTQHPPRNQGSMASECLHAPFPQRHQAACGPGPLAVPTPHTGPGPNKDAILRTLRLSKSVLSSF